MTVQVDPTQLEAHAAQLELNSALFQRPFREYCTEHCARTEGMTGVLAAAQPLVELARESTCGLVDSGERQLFQLASNLRTAAASYRQGDEAAAERAWLVRPHRAPDDYPDRADARHPGDFTDPATPALSAPRERHDLDHAVEEVKQQLGELDVWLRDFLHFSLAEQVLPWLSGDWGTLRANADGYAELAGPRGVQVLAVNLTAGANSLSAGWNSPAATQFDYTIRDRWVPAIDALSRLLDLHKEHFEWLSQQSENTLQALVLLIEALKFWVIEKVLRIIGLAGAMLGMGRIAQEIAELIANVLKVWHQIKMIFELLELACRNAVELGQALRADARVIEDLWLASDESRLSPLLSG